MTTWVNAGLTNAAVTGALLGLGLEAPPAGVPAGRRRERPTGGRWPADAAETGRLPRYPDAYLPAQPTPAGSPVNLTDGFLAGSVTALASATPAGWDSAAGAIGPWGQPTALTPMPAASLPAAPSEPPAARSDALAEPSEPRSEPSATSSGADGSATVSEVLEPADVLGGSGAEAPEAPEVPEVSGVSGVSEVSGGSDLAESSPVDQPSGALAAPVPAEVTLEPGALGAAAVTAAGELAESYRLDGLADDPLGTGALDRSRLEPALLEPQSAGGPGYRPTLAELAGFTGAAHSALDAPLDLTGSLEAGPVAGPVAGSGDTGRHAGSAPRIGSGPALGSLDSSSLFGALSRYGS